MNRDLVQHEQTADCDLSRPKGEGRVRVLDFGDVSSILR
jgi:hypothetical protein